MFRSGLEQRRQSDGNSVAKRLSAIPLAQNAREPGGPTTAAPEARIGSALLLKTILPARTKHRPDAPELSISGWIAARNAPGNTIVMGG